MIIRMIMEHILFWLSLDEVDVWDSKEKQRANYKNNFEGKNVFVTMSDIVNIIKEYYEIL